MPLARTNKRYTSGVDGVHFLMQDGPMEVVCTITVEALSQLGRTMGLTVQTEIFETSREAIERTASDKYDRTARRPYEMVIVTIDDLDLST